MIFWLIGLAAIALYGVRIGARKNPLSRSSTNCINAVFVLYIFLSHAKNMFGTWGYDFTQEFGISAANVFFGYIGQLCVVPFLFFSGYGMAERISESGASYVKGIPQRRILPFVLNSLPVTIIWVLIGIFLIGDCSWRDIVAQLLFWDGIDYGPCWYNFCIVALWLIMWLSCVVKFHGGGLVVFLSIVLWRIKGGESWWYDTLWAFPYGVWFSRHKTRYVDFINRHYWLSLMVSLFLFRLLVTSYAHRFFTMLHVPHVISHNLLGLVFATLIVVIMQRLSVSNKILDWIGAHVFGIYMIHCVFFCVIWRVLVMPTPLTAFSVHATMVVSLVLTLLTVHFVPMYKGVKHGNG